MASEALARWAARTEASLERLLPDPAIEPVGLHAAMRHATLGGGKRMRPLLVFAAGAATGADEARLDAPAAAVELVHAYSLVHDDLPAMDDDDLRRGRPTVHVAFDEATAILAGDALQTLAFTTLADPVQMPGVRYRSINWPYREGLRIDEAMHPLTLLATGLYGKPLPQQNGAPLRLVVPWKYGFKSIKSIVEIKFVERMPETAWHDLQPSEYGFFSNVNPDVDHPRWSQKTERRIAGTQSKLFAERIPTRMFNGYADQVASLYAGLDLKKWY